MKHYSLALRRIAKNVRTPVRRKHTATLAATLLLGYYEVWNGDHNTWCNHLYGARILLAEMQLRDMSKRCLPAKALKDRYATMRKMGLYDFGMPIPKDLDELDFKLLSTITGYHIQATDYCLTEDQVFSMDHSRTTDRDLRDYDNLRDLFWWYCKMDVYQGILGGTPLLYVQCCSSHESWANDLSMDYGNWTECLPRAPLSRLDRMQATSYHGLHWLVTLTHVIAMEHTTT